jgi:hypothetical protein
MYGKRWGKKRSRFGSDGAAVTTALLYRNHPAVPEWSRSMSDPAPPSR